MRMNRGTIVLIAALLVVIVAVLVINNNQASAPGVTPTVAGAEVSGPLLPGLTADSIVRYEVRDNKSGFFTSLTKDSGGGWHIDGTNTVQGRDPDQSLVNSTASQIVSINYNNTFQDSQLATFGLDAPAYTITALTNDGRFFTLYIGAKAPTSSRYYAVLVNSTVAPSTAEATTESGEAPQAIATENVAAQQDNSDASVPASTGAAGTATPYVLPGTTPVATSEATAETTAAAKKIFRGLQDALAQATVEPTEQATAESTVSTDNTTSALQNGSNAAQNNSAAITETPFFLPGTTPVATTEATAEVTAEATANVVQNPGVTLTGNQTIYVIPQTVVDTLTKWINTPPYAPLPTGVPTNEALTPEASAESTNEAIGVAGTIQPTVVLEQGADSSLIPGGTPFATQEVTPEATAAATAGS